MSIYAKTTMKHMPGSCNECQFGRRYGLVGDVECRILREYFTGNVKPPYKERPNECPLTESILRHNDPLTPEEMKEMNGEPVWWEDKYGNAGHGIASVTELGRIIYIVSAVKEVFCAVVDGEINERLGLKIYRYSPEVGNLTAEIEYLKAENAKLHKENFWLSGGRDEK